MNFHKIDHLLLVIENEVKNLKEQNLKAEEERAKCPEVKYALPNYEMDTLFKIINGFEDVNRRILGLQSAINLLASLQAQMTKSLRFQFNKISAEIDYQPIEGFSQKNPITSNPQIDPNAIKIHVTSSKNEKEEEEHVDHIGVKLYTDKQM